MDEPPEKRNTLVDALIVGWAEASSGFAYFRERQDADVVLHGEILPARKAQA
jgi:hypothetical protein